MNKRKQLTDMFPTYRVARHFLRVLDGVPCHLYHSTWRDIRDQRGDRENPEDWKKPDDWIPERLDGEQRALALRMWRESSHELTPRYVRGIWGLTTKHGLLAEDLQGILHVTERGQCFLAEPEGRVVVEIDEYEGFFVILELLAERGPSKRAGLLSGWTAYCHTSTTWDADSIIESSLRFRSRNLIDRKYVDRHGHTYTITRAGIDYFRTHSSR
jgi:restriction system protein